MIIPIFLSARGQVILYITLGPVLAIFFLGRRGVQYSLGAPRVRLGNGDGTVNDDIDLLNVLIGSNAALAVGSAAADNLIATFRQGNEPAIEQLQMQLGGWVALGAFISDWGEEAYEDVAEIYSSLLKANGIYAAAIEAIELEGPYDSSDAATEAAVMVGLGLGIAANIAALGEQGLVT